MRRELCAACGETRLSRYNPHETLCRNCSGWNAQREQTALDLLIAALSRGNGSGSTTPEANEAMARFMAEVP